MNRRTFFGLVGFCSLAIALSSGCRLGVDKQKMSEVRGEQWAIPGGVVVTVSTFYERGDGLGVNYVIQWGGFSEKELFGINDESGFELARPLLTYVHQNRTFERTKFLPVRGTSPPPIRIVVELKLASQPQTKGYRVTVPSGELSWRLNRRPE